MVLPPKLDQTDELLIVGFSRAPRKFGFKGRESL